MTRSDHLSSQNRAMRTVGAGRPIAFAISGLGKSVPSSQILVHAPARYTHAYVPMRACVWRARMRIVPGRMGRRENPFRDGGLRRLQSLSRSSIVGRREIGDGE